MAGDYCQQAAIQWETMVRKFMIENATTNPMVSIVANDNWVEFTLRYVVDYKKRVIVKEELFRKILEKVEKSAGQVQRISTTFELVDAPPIEAKSKE